MQPSQSRLRARWTARALCRGLPVGVPGIHGALRSRFLQRPQAEIEGERVLDHLQVALTERVSVLAACAVDQLLIEHQIYLTRSHRQDRIPGDPGAGGMLNQTKGRSRRAVLRSNAAVHLPLSPA